MLSFQTTWWSRIGFQSCSMKTRVSADVRFKPRPPTVIVILLAYTIRWPKLRKGKTEEYEPTMCCKEQYINCRIRIEGLNNVKPFFWLNRSIQSQVRNTAGKEEFNMKTRTKFVGMQTELVWATVTILKR